ncbi:hypothetical protein SLEP1_g45963 [Rubroshorea leprosula]|uniref:Secreted protein n=1 Tax=Rubroshorea leprosula TaxID=152421 RepID=A0AAV5LKX9_9ROSI|nr:hypothetical protein SLEP1_g45963 [Rubroshorea leprosula]
MGVISYLFFLCILRYSSYNHPCCVARCREMQVRNAYASQKLKVWLPQPPEFQSFGWPVLCRNFQALSNAEDGC